MELCLKDKKNKVRRGMEIEFQLEDSDLVFTFEPDWDRKTHSSRRVQWQLSHGSHSGALADMFNDIPT